MQIIELKIPVETLTVMVSNIYYSIDYHVKIKEQVDNMLKDVNYPNEKETNYVSMIEIARLQTLRHRLHQLSKSAWHLNKAVNNTVVDKRYEGTEKELHSWNHRLYELLNKYHL